MITETTLSIDEMLKTARDDILFSSEPIAKTDEGMVVVGVRETRNRVIRYLAERYFEGKFTNDRKGKYRDGFRTEREVIMQLKEIFENATIQLCYRRARVSFELNTEQNPEYRFKVKRVLDTTIGRDNEYFLAPLAK